MKKPDYIIKLEQEGGVFSKIKSYDRDDKFFDQILSKNYQVVYSISEYEKGKKPYFTEVILQTQQPFYVHLLKKDNGWSMDIYYLADKYKELIFFINQIEKSITNATTNNNRAQAKN